MQWLPEKESYLVAYISEKREGIQGIIKMKKLIEEEEF